MGDIAVQLPILKELKQQGRIRYIGATTTSPTQYAERQPSHWSSRPDERRHRLRGQFVGDCMPRPENCDPRGLTSLVEHEQTL